MRGTSTSRCGGRRGSVSLVGGNAYGQGTPTTVARRQGEVQTSREVRRDNGKLLHDGPHVATADNDGNTVTLTLFAGETYTVEAAGDSGDFSLSIEPQ